MNQRNITWHEGIVSRADRERIVGQKGCVVWLTGLSGCGKSTVARALEMHLTAHGRLCYVLDGDNIRHGLNADLGFTVAERDENLRRITEVAALFADAGVIAITAFISPLRAARERARARIGTERFVEIFLNVPIAVCESRDPKQLYKRARAGEIMDFTGIDSPYEQPLRPDLELDAVALSPAGCVESIVKTLVARSLVGSEQAEKGLPDSP